MNNKYNLELKEYHNWSIGQYVLVRAKNALNLKPLIDQFKSIQGVSYVQPNRVIGDGNDIELIGNRLIYSYGFDDCPAGCINHYYLTFEVDVDCSVSFLGSGKYPLSNENIYSPFKNTSKRPVINLYPNPTSDIVVIDFESDNLSEVLLNIIDLGGKVISSKYIEINNNHFTQIVDLSIFPKGIYFIKLQSGSFSELKRVILL